MLIPDYKGYGVDVLVELPLGGVQVGVHQLLGGFICDLRLQEMDSNLIGTDLVDWRLTLTLMVCYF